MYGISIIMWLSMAILFYTFLGYGILLRILVFIKNSFKEIPVKRQFVYEPDITLIVPCYNEAYSMDAKIRNCLELDYPADKINFLFITDGSTDHFAQVLHKYPRIRSLHQPLRSGKTAAENRAMQYVNTQLVIFSDANTLLNKESIRKITRHFQNEQVGCVSGEKRILTHKTDTASAAGEGMYWKYESALKELDSDLNSAIGAVGELIAVRSHLYKTLPEDTLLDDFMQSMLIAAEGYKVVYEPEAIATEKASLNIREELKRKIRISTGSWQAMDRLSNVVLFSKTPLLYFQYFSHRILRWAVAPFLLILAFLLNIVLVYGDDDLWGWILFFQVCFYISAVAGYLVRNKNLVFKSFFIPYYFCLMHYAVLAGLVKYKSGKQDGVWEKAERKEY